MIWILATRGASTKLRSSPFTETSIEGVHSVVYRPGVEAIPGSGADGGGEELGTFQTGLHRVSGLVLSYHGSAAETLFAITSAIDLIIRYQANGAHRKRTLADVLFVGDGSVIIPSLSRGRPELIAVPFRVQIPEGETLAGHITDTVDS